MDVPAAPVDQDSATAVDDIPPLRVTRPLTQTAPVLFASPHSGRHYSPDFIASSRLDPLSLRRSEDSFVDELFAAAPSHGAPLLRREPRTVGA